MTVQSIGSWSWASVTTRSPASMWPLTLSTVSGVGDALLQRGRQGHRLHDRAGLEDVGDERVAEQLGVGRRVVARVVAGAGAHRDDLAGAARRGRRRRPGSVAPSAQASPSRCSVTYCRSWSRVRVTVSPSVAGVDSSMPDGIGLPPLPTSTRRWPGGAGELVLEGLLDAGQPGAVAADEADDLAADRAGRVQPDRVVLEEDARQLERRRWRRWSPATPGRPGRRSGCPRDSFSVSSATGDVEQRRSAPARCAPGPRPPCGSATTREASTV